MGKFLQPRQQVTLPEYVEIRRQCRDIACILQLSDNLCQRELLRRIRTTQLKELLHQCRLVDIGGQNHILLNSRSNKRFPHIFLPSAHIFRKTGRPGIAAIVDVLVQRPPE